MCLPAHFAQEDPALLHALMRDHPLATLVTLQGGEPMADQVPLRVSRSRTKLRARSPGR